MMLFYKFWRESRTRFLLLALMLTGFCIGAIVFRPALQNTLPGLKNDHWGAYIYHLVYSGEVRSVFSLLLIFLALGGLLREQAGKTALFTLALPVSRAQLVGAFVAVGLAELALLSLLPALILPLLSAFVHQSWPIVDALRYSLLWFVCGSAIFAASFLLSVLMAGQYTAPAAALIASYAEARIANWTPIQPWHLNIMRTMAARWDWSASLPQIHEPLPWLNLSITMLVAFALFAAATRITQRQDL